MKSGRFILFMVIAGLAAAMLCFAPGPAMAQGTKAGPLSVPGHDSGQSALNINTASIEQLQAVGISPAVAQRIIVYRGQHGAFGSIDELAEVEGVTPELVNRIKTKVTVTENPNAW